MVMCVDLGSHFEFCLVSNLSFDLLLLSYHFLLQELLPWFKLVNLLILGLS